MFMFIFKIFLGFNRLDLIIKLFKLVVILCGVNMIFIVDFDDVEVVYK